MTAFVLIHGGFMGGWVWKPTVQVLAAAAHEVYAPTLDGCGERASQVRPGITLTSQAEEVAEMLFLQDINDAVLVSTSTGGLVAAKTAELARKRVRHLVFVDALAPQPGEAISDIVIPQPNMSYEFTELTRVLSRSFMETGMFRDLQPDLRSWAMARRKYVCAHSMKTRRASIVSSGDAKERPTYSSPNLSFTDGRERGAA